MRAADRKLSQRIPGSAANGDFLQTGEAGLQDALEHGEPQRNEARGGRIARASARLLCGSTTVRIAREMG